MYKIIAYDKPTDTVGTVVYDPTIDKHISGGKLNLKESEIDDLQLTVNQDNYLFGNVVPLQTVIDVFQDNNRIFRGRALDITREMKDSGQFLQSFSFESIQNYLQDTSQRWAKIQNTTPKQFFQSLIDTHNNQVPVYKQFTVRNVTVTNSTDNVYRYIDDGSTTWDTIKDKLVSRLGGYIVVEYVNGVNYIDYLQDVGTTHENDTPIKIATNMQSASVKIDPTEVITQLVPLGANIQSTNGDETNTSTPRIDITSVNGGKDYIDIPTLQSEFGIVRKSVTWEDVNTPAILLTKAKQWVSAQVSATESWAISALELTDFETFNVSDKYLFINEFVATEQLLRITAKEIDFNDWTKSSLTIADKEISLSRYQLENKNAAKKVSTLNSKIVSYGAKINQLNSQAEEMEKTINDQTSLIENIKKDVDDANLSGITQKLNDLSESVNDLGTQISNLNYVPLSDYTAYQDSQKTLTDDFEKRIKMLENKEINTNG
ncbi:hypothetical protein FGL80_07700 [Leuconostoc lactis]|uniref:phage tail protein n=1 Tax=Leuconostoc lactis TaxID=1246 RepID=UPI0011BB06EB|nr:phage tail protein [Leuconostoc lactis]QEA48080.1 hypothetical protein FGL80_07700 [Leuconostoc lactis]